MTSSQGPTWAAPPSLLAPVTLVVRFPDGDSSEWSTRVWDVEQDARTTTGGEVPTWVAVVARPEQPEGRARAVPLTTRDGEPVRQAELTWVTPAGVWGVPVVVQAAERVYGPVWTLTPVDLLRRHQRRAHFRVPLAASLVLEFQPTPDEEAVQVPAMAVDLGEGGLLSALRGDAPPAGMATRVRIDLPEGAVAVDATVVRVMPLPGGLTGVALQFVTLGQPDPTLRRALMRIQRQQAQARSF